MSRKMKVLVSILVAILLLTVGGTTIALAQEDEEPVNGSDNITELEELLPELLEVMPAWAEDGLLARVAGILGISEDELRDAIRQAREETGEERFTETLYRILDKAVEEEIITEDEAEEIKEWWQQKPDALDLGLLPRVFGAMPGAGLSEHPQLKRHLYQWMNRIPSSDTRQEMLEKALEEGLITKEQLGTVKQWQGARPQASNSLSPGASISKANRGQQMGAMRKGGNGTLSYQVAE